MKKTSTQPQLKTEVELNKWPNGWLDEEVGRRLGNHLYATMLTRERKELSYPATREEQIDYLQHIPNNKYL